MVFVLFKCLMYVPIEIVLLHGRASLYPSTWSCYAVSKSLPPHTKCWWVHHRVLATFTTGGFNYCCVSMFELCHAVCVPLCMINISGIYIWISSHTKVSPGPISLQWPVEYTHCDMHPISGWKAMLVVSQDQFQYLIKKTFYWVKHIHTHHRRG